jgi:hypothetical protein
VLWKVQLQGRHGHVRERRTEVTSRGTLVRTRDRPIYTAGHWWLSFLAMSCPSLPTHAYSFSPLCLKDLRGRAAELDGKQKFVLPHKSYRYDLFFGRR